MNDFYSYEKMPESFSKIGFDLPEIKKAEKAEWVVCEKVHGANFSFILDAEGIGYAKRKEPLAWEDDFFGFQLPAMRLQSSLYTLFDVLQLSFPEMKKAQLYGELFGGKYPHPDLPAIEGLQPIQTGIWYSPDIHFCAFDLAWTDAAGERSYLAYSELVKYCNELGIFYAKPLFVGSLQQALNFDIRRASDLPALLGLPPLAEFNLIEGVVVKPYQELLLETAKGPIRPVVKIKNPEFIEEEQYAEAKKWSYKLESDSDTQLYFLSEFQRFLNKNRLQNAISKIGYADNAERRAAIRELLWEDVLEAYLASDNAENIEPQLLPDLKRLMMPLIRELMNIHLD